MTLVELQSTRKTWKDDGLKVVFTNGCFDILHYGHVAYLEEAAELGDRLIVGLNSDDSVSRLKGPHRPIQNQASREKVISALRCVDAVVLFDTDTPQELISALLPDVLVKGGDYTPDTVVGAKEVIGHGGEVKILTFVDGYSTSAIEQKIKHS